MVIGEPTGLSAKLWNAPDRALDFGLAFSFNDYFLIFSDYLFHFAGALGHSSVFVNELTPYVGIGAMLAFSNDDKYYTDRRFFGRHRNSVGLGLRIPLGIEWQPASPGLRGLTVFAQANNLLNRRYSTAAQLGATAFDANGNFVAQPFAANANGDRPLLRSSFLAPGAPRSVQMGLRYRFGG